MVAQHVYTGPRKPIILVPRRSVVESLATASIALALVLGTGMVARLVIEHKPPRVGVPAGDYANALSDRDAGLPPGLTVAWRPSASTESLDEDARAARIGARITDVEMASYAYNGDMAVLYHTHSQAARLAVRAEAPLVAALAGELGALLADVPNGEQAAGMYARVGQEARDQATVNSELQYGRRLVAAAFDNDYIALGNWIEAARIAALRGDRDFFDSPSSRLAWATLPAFTDATPASRAALDRLYRMMPDGRAGNLVALEHALTHALRVIAN